jgi:hypothetical protein
MSRESRGCSAESQRGVEESEARRHLRTCVSFHHNMFTAQGTRRLSQSLESYRATNADHVFAPQTNGPPANADTDRTEEIGKQRNGLYDILCYLCANRLRH